MEQDRLDKLVDLALAVIKRDKLEDQLSEARYELFKAEVDAIVSETKAEAEEARRKNDV